MAQKGLYKKANDPWGDGRKACKDGRAKEKRFFDSLEKEAVKKHPKRKKTTSTQTINTNKKTFT